MQGPAEILADLIRDGITVRFAGGAVRLRAPKGMCVPAETVEALRPHRDEVFRLVREVGRYQRFLPGVFPARARPHESNRRTLFDERVRFRNELGPALADAV